MVAAASDKWCTEQIFRKHGIRTPRSWLPTALPADLPERLFVKPRDGSASAHAYRTPSTHLSGTLVRVPNPIIQEELAGQEITVDALISLEGLPIHYVPRLRIKTVGGESVQGMTLPDEDLRGWLVRVMEVAAGLGARGPITIQAFLTDNGPVLTEINPRFGGGFPLTYAAGGSYPEWVVRMVSGERLEPRIGEYRRGLYMTRHYVERFVEAPLCT
jgi:carbamoyl-phosphate synthase large subunit